MESSNRVGQGSSAMEILELFRAFDTLRKVEIDLTKSSDGHNGEKLFQCKGNYRMDTLTNEMMKSLDLTGRQIEGNKQSLLLENKILREIFLMATHEIN